MRKLKMNELNRLSVDEFKHADKKPIVLVLENIRSLNNIGSIFRTADAFRLEKVILCGITACPPHREIQKTALGSTESVEWIYYKNAIDAVKDQLNKNYTIIALEQTDNSTFLNEFTPEIEKKYVIILGNEVRGVSDDILKLAHFVVEIPQFGTKHSFNVTVSTGIILWDMLLKMNFLK
jgi:tRNA G18 (ribose-2'-O)-methylase SpoU